MTQILIQGLLLIGLYTMITIGFIRIFRIDWLLNLAYGAYLMLGGYAYFWISRSLGATKIVGVVVTIALGAAVTLNILTAAVASWLILIGLWIFVSRTHTGRAIQAVSMDVKGGGDLRRRSGPDESGHLGDLRHARGGGGRLLRFLDPTLPGHVGGRP